MFQKKFALFFFNIISNMSFDPHYACLKSSINLGLVLGFFVCPIIFVSYDIKQLLFSVAHQLGLYHPTTCGLAHCTYG
jgi:hypothetical protein